MLVNRSNVIVSLVLAMVFFLFLSQVQSDVPAKTQGFQHYCGWNLVETLREVCNGRYNERTKRSGQEPEMEKYLHVYDYLLNSRARANAMIRRSDMLRYRRHPKSISEECCMKGCTVDDMKAYCQSETN